MRFALQHGVSPNLFAMGAAAALLFYRPGKKEMWRQDVTSEEAMRRLENIWGDKDFKYRQEILSLIKDAYEGMKICRSR